MPRDSALPHPIVPHYCKHFMTKPSNRVCELLTSAISQTYRGAGIEEK